MQDYPDLSKHQVYACGAPMVIESAKRDFAEQCALPPQEFFADSFLDAGDRARARIWGHNSFELTETSMNSAVKMFGELRAKGRIKDFIVKPRTLSQALWKFTN